MKKIILFACLFMASTLTFAGWKSAMLRLKHETGRSISVTIDGRKYNKIGRSITVSDLPPGNHRIKIYRYSSNGYGYSGGVLIYQGMLNMRPGRIYYAVVSNDGLDVEENCCIDDYGHWNQNDQWDDFDDYQSPDSNDPDDRNWNNNNRWNQDRRDNYDDNSWGNYHGQMSEGRFQSLIDQIRKASFESSKTSVAKQALRNNRITCSQLLRILNEFSFESTKLQFAKDAYRSVVDRNNYFQVNDAFTFQSSKDELLEFLEQSAR